MRLERLVRLSSSPPVPEQQRQKYERHARAAASGLHRLRAAKASTRSLCMQWASSAHAVGMCSACARAHAVGTSRAALRH